jgi:hypothetical protein
VRDGGGFRALGFQRLAMGLWTMCCAVKRGANFDRSILIVLRLGSFYISVEKKSINPLL